MNLPAWWNSPLGQLLRQQEQRVVSDALDDVFGLQLVQIGAWGAAGEFFGAARTQRQTVIARELNFPSDAGARVVSHPAVLPIASESIDAALLPHTLEFESDPYAVLREVSRILVGEGKLLILGFTPFGPWALRHRFSDESFPPALERLVPPSRLKEWLRVLNFEVISITRYLHRLPSARHGEHRWLIPPSAYLIKAQKRVYTLTPIKPVWREKRPRIGSLAEPSTRTMRS